MQAVVILNIAAALVLSAYALHQAMLLLLFLSRRARVPGRGTPHQAGPDWPAVTVQLPLFNERYVTERIIGAACALDYPRDRLQIQVLDDSTDDTRSIAQRAVQAARKRGLNVELVARDSRTGFKAGALAHALRSATGEFIAVFDADFMPGRDFLLGTLPHFGRPEERVGFVQTRWGFVNAADGPLTRGQAAMLNMHFVTEQTARSGYGLLMNFNGSGGVWRRACIDDAGGWQADCLSEDLDLSIRAEVRGWRGRYLNAIEAPSELPGDLLAFKRQQTRWARGSAQVIRKLLRDIWTSGLSLPAKALGTLHISGYAIHLCIIVLALTTPLIALSGLQVPVWVGLVSLVGLAPVLSMYAASRWQGRSALDFARDLPWAVMLGIGVSVSNAAGLCRGFAQPSTGEFTRTPKVEAARAKPGARQAHAEAQHGYALSIDWTVWCELFIAIWSAVAAAALLSIGNLVAASTCALYGFGFGGVAALQLRAWALERGFIRSESAAAAAE